MGFRFRRSIRLGKGLRINISKTGASLSAGRRGATVNFGPKGQKVTIGLPGTGMSYSKMLRPAKQQKAVSAEAEARKPISSPNSGRFFVWVLILWLAAAGVLGILTYTFGP